MKPSIDLFLTVAAFVCFALAAYGFEDKGRLTALGLALLTLTLLV